MMKIKYNNTIDNDDALEDEDGRDETRRWARRYGVHTPNQGELIKKEKDKVRRHTERSSKLHKAGK